MLEESQRQLLLDNPALFIAYYFPHAIGLDRNPPGKLESFHLRLIAMTKEVRALALYPAGHGKSTLISTLLPIWEICRNPNVRIAIIAKNTIEGEGIMRAIQAEMVDNQELVRDFGPFQPVEDGKAWSLSRIDVHKRTIRHKSSTIAMFGASSKTVLGYRTDWTICDDVVDDVNSATPEARQKLKDWFNLRVETGPEHATSRLTVVGTRFHPEDLYGDLLELSVPDDEDDTKLVRFFKVYEEDRDAIVDEEGHKTLWPWRWPWKRLQKERIRLGTLAFNKRYRNIAVDESRLVFKEEYVYGGWIGKNQFPGVLDTTYKIGEYEDHWRKVAGFDPAIGSSKHAKFCAHITLAEGSCKDHDRCFWVIDCERDQWSLPQQVEKIITKHQEFQLLSSQVEANSYQAGLLEALQAKMREQDIALSIEPHYTNKQNKPDPELGVGAMAPWVERGAWHIPWGDAHSRRRMGVLVEEMVMYPGRTTDTVMAMWFAWRKLETGANRYGSMNRMERQVPQLHKRLGRRIVRNPAYVRQDAA